MKQVRTNPKVWLFLVFAAVVVTLAAWPSRPTEKRPNVVLIIIDTLRQDKLGAYGFEKDISPEIDRLAAGGVRFDRAIAQSSWTRPSIASMLTSHYPRTLGIYDEDGDSLADRFETLAEVLKEAGYTTLGATANPNINSSFNFQQGFDHYSDSDVVFQWMNPGDGQERQLESPLLTARQVFDGLLEQVNEGGSAPYYLQANVMEVHEYLDPRLDLSEYEPMFEEGPERRYLATIRLVSREVGRFIDELKNMPDFENTLFVIVSDHGEGLGDHLPLLNSWSHGFLLYESQVLVPFVLHATDDSLPRGTVVKRPVRLLDVFPTILDHLDIEEPSGLAGTSLLGAVNGSSSPPLPERFVVETQCRTADVIGTYGGDWKYFEHRAVHPGTDPRELQKKGSVEKGTISNQLENHPAVSEELSAALRQWELDHPKAQPTKRAAPLLPVEEAQLRALGYIE
jgi:arylsulfatase A-like enzyme